MTSEEKDARIAWLEELSQTRAGVITAKDAEIERLGALIDKNHTDAMIAHRFFESLLGEEEWRGRDFALKVPQAEKVISAHDEEIETLSYSILNICGDNLCWLGSEQSKIPPKAEFLESCARFHAQMEETNGVIEGGQTIAQLEVSVTRLTSALKVAREALGRIQKWIGEFPDSGQVWSDGTSMSYGAAFGSNGERDYMRKVAAEAIANIAEAE